MISAQSLLGILYLAVNLFVLFKSCIKDQLRHKQKGLWEKDYKRIQHLIFLGLVFAYELISMFLLYNNNQNYMIMLVLAAILILMLINHFLIAGKKTKFYLIIPLAQVFGIIGVNLFSASNEFKIIILIVIVSILNEYPIEFAKRFALMPLVLYMGLSALFYVIFENRSFWFVTIFIIRNSITYLLVVGAFYVGRKQFLMNQQLHKMNCELRENSRQLEEISLIKERNRIAREIHDTLGHTLTGAIIQLEAAKKLIHVDLDKTLIAIEKTQEINREGFMEVKRAIQALRPILIEDGNLMDSLEALFEKTEKDFHIHIKRNIHPHISDEDAFKVPLYRIIQESITNSIRHGQATLIEINLEMRKNTIEMTIIDNGKGCFQIKENYGLQGIRERVAILGGRIQIHSNPNEGFQLQISIPETH